MTESKQAETFQAKTIDQALKKAAQHFACDVSELEHELISQTDAGLLSFLGGKKVELRVWRKKRDEKISSKDRLATKNKEPLSEEQIRELVQDLKDFCANICTFLNGQQRMPKVETQLKEGRLKLNIKDDEVAKQLAKNSRLAESLEHLLRKKPRYLKRELPFKIFIDANGVRAGREDELISMARDLSRKVVENQRPIVLNYRSSYDRKIIHMALDKDERVFTKSIGSGSNRKLMILPVKENASAERIH